MANTRIVCEGQKLNFTVPDSAKQTQQRKPTDKRIPLNINFQGVNGNNAPDNFVLTEKLLSQHIMLVGGIGSGKTNTFNHILANIAPRLTSDDVMIIFDTKGDFYKEFYKPGDVVISNDKTACGPDGRPNYWNLVNELDKTIGIKEDVIEIANSLFADKLKNAGENAFFPQAAKDIFSALLYHFASKNNATTKISNYTMSKAFKKEDITWYRDQLESYPEYSAMLSYIPENAPGQALGVLAEIQQLVRSIFVGNFEKQGTLSIRDLVRQKGGRKIFIEYDIGIGGMLTPIYTLLFDLAIKEALCRSKSEGNVYFVCDEFKLLPNLNHIDDAVNFGRSLGIKFMIGIQNVDQIIDIYNENRAMNIFSGFINMFAFKVGDYTTRKYVKERCGENRKFTSYRHTSTIETVDAANVVEDWDIANLRIGEAIVSLNGSEPFNFRFSEYMAKNI